MTQADMTPAQGVWLGIGLLLMLVVLVVALLFPEGSKARNWLLLGMIIALMVASAYSKIH